MFTKLVVDENSRTIIYQLKTFFYCRYEIFKFLSKKDNNNKLDDIIEADGAFFEESQK